MLKFKVHGETQKLGKHVKIFKGKQNLRIHSDVKVTKKYIKYLTKKYLKKQMLGEWVRIVTTKKDETVKGGVGYKLQYFPIANDEADGNASDDE